MKQFIWITLFLFLIGCAEKSNTIEQVINESQGFQSEDVIEIIEHGDKYASILYKKEDRYGLGLVERKNNSWKWVVGSFSPLDHKQDVTYSYYDLINRYPVFIGTVNNDRIHKVEVQTNKKTKEVAVQTSANGFRYWYVFIDEPQGPPNQITGYDGDGKIVYLMDERLK
ncbi:hypothetical protein ACK8P5_05200 [Paenibacillus sp. EC2-1]|uniref:hypothetical protein n=1 Tax=Paenibacillus sp. EC2-1 TaxID=3388665 RepID=UPI003BEF450B